MYVTLKELQGGRKVIVVVVVEFEQLKRREKRFWKREARGREREAKRGGNLIHPIVSTYFRKYYVLCVFW